MVFGLEGESSPTIYVINDWLIVPLPCISQFSYAGYAVYAIEAIQELILHLPSAINGCRSKVCIPIDCKALKRSHNLLY